VGSSWRPGYNVRHFSLSDLTIYPVTTAVLPNIRVCRDVMPCRWLISFRRFGGTWCLQLQGKAVREDCMAVKMEALRSFETSGANHPMTRLHVPEDAILLVKRQVECQCVSLAFCLYRILYCSDFGLLINNKRLPATCREGTEGEWRYNSTHASPRR
jgi:hypothetical protein